MSQRGAARRFESLAQLGQAMSASLELPAVLAAIADVIRGIVVEPSASSRAGHAGRPTCAGFSAGRGLIGRARSSRA